MLRQGLLLIARNCPRFNNPLQLMEIMSPQIPTCHIFPDFLPAFSLPTLYILMPMNTPLHCIISLVKRWVYLCIRCNFKYWPSSGPIQVPGSKSTTLRPSDQGSSAGCFHSFCWFSQHFVKTRAGGGTSWSRGADETYPKGILRIVHEMVETLTTFSWFHDVSWLSNRSRQLSDKGEWHPYMKS